MGFAFRAALYPIVDDGFERSPIELAEQVIAAGAPLLQLRMKAATTRDLIDVARELRTRTAAAGVTFIVNDRADVAALVGADGVHLGQTDLPPAAAREIVGADAIIGFSTHDRDQLQAALRDESVDYLAYGPIFATSSKQNPDPVRGIDELRRAAALCSRPLVAIGGIQASNISEVVGAGADAAAVIAAIAGAADPSDAVATLLEAASA